MRGLESIGRAASGLLLLVVATSFLGCGLFRKGEVQATPEPAEVVDTKSPEATADPPEPAEVVDTQSPEATADPPAKKPPSVAKTSAGAQAVPEIDQVSVAEPPEPRLLQTEEGKVSASSLRDEFIEAERLSAELAKRKLTAEQLAQVESGRGFLYNAREALELRDLQRAGVLLEKCLVLLKDAEANSRT